jgi:4-oxalocrotonate tautomerase
MPLIQVTMVEGRTVEQKHALIAKLTDAMVEAVGTPRDRVRVAIYEISGDEWGIGGQAFNAVRAAPTGAAQADTSSPTTDSPAPADDRTAR